MKLKLYIITLFLGISSGIFAQATAMQTSIQTCNSKSLSKHFTDNIELNILDEEDIYSKTQAEMILKSFFGKKECKKFEIIHTGKAKGESEYSIGELTTTKSTYRVYYVVKNKEILEFSIEEN